MYILHNDYNVCTCVCDVCVSLCVGYEKCTLVAHDWGGAVAYKVAYAYPSIVEKMVVCNCPHPGAMRRALDKGIQQMRKSWSVYP